MSNMDRVEHIESQIRQLTPDELHDLRVWFANFDAELWDRQFEQDVEAGKLNRLAEQALRDHNAGKSTEL